MAAFRQSKYSKEMTSELTFRALDVLISNPNPMSIDEIQKHDIVLAPITSQKMARVLCDLCDRGLVMKTKSKSKGRMVYAAIANLEAQGYDIEKIVC